MPVKAAQQRAVVKIQALLLRLRNRAKGHAVVAHIKPKRLFGVLHFFKDQRQLPGIKLLQPLCLPLTQTQQHTLIAAVSGKVVFGQLIDLKHALFAAVLLLLQAALHQPHRAVEAEAVPGDVARRQLAGHIRLVVGHGVPEIFD